MRTRTLGLGVVALAAMACGNTSAPTANGAVEASSVATQRAALSTPTKHMPPVAPHARFNDDLAAFLATRAHRVDATGDATAAVGPDEARRADRFPAFLPNIGQVVAQGGAVMTSPKIVTVTFDGDLLRDGYERFGDQIGSTHFWEAATAEYGVGPATSGPRNHVHSSESLGTQISMADLQTWIATHVTAGAAGWPTFAADNLYTVYLPTGVTLTMPDPNTGAAVDACSQLLAYHSWTAPDGTNTLTDATHAIVYAVVVRCANSHDFTMTEAASHELVEASTDPYPQLATGNRGFDPDHGAFEYMWGGVDDELADVCNWYDSSYEESAPFDFQVQRSWSNRSARHGHNPCRPMPGAPYHNVTTLPGQAMDNVQVLKLWPYDGTMGTTPGFTIPIGHSRTIDIGFYSDAPTNGSWSLSAVTNWLDFFWPPGVDANGNPYDNGTLDVSITDGAGRNGHVAHVTITPKSTGWFGGELLVLQSRMAGRQYRAYPILIGN
jgi:hypothetical protein